MRHAPAARLEAIRMLLAFAAHHDFKLYQMDVKSAFLNSPIQELVYVEQPPGFEDPKFQPTSTNSKRRSTGLSKHQEHSMNTLRTSCSNKALK
jgi:hypothetical protein